MKIKLIQGTTEQVGGYSVDGVEFISDEAEALVDEAKELAYSIGCQVEAALAALLRL